MELTGDQLEKAEEELRRYLPRSLTVYGTLVLNKRVRADPVKFIVDKWPEFRVFICKPQCLQEDDLYRDTDIFTTDPAALKEIVENSSVIDWTKFMRLAIDLCHIDVLTGMASEKNVSSNKVSVCQVMILQDVSRLPPIDSSGISLGSLDESHVDLVAQTWKFGKGGAAKNMIRNMVVNFPSCCVLDADGKPVSWILTYSRCEMGMLHTLPEHRLKGYAKVVTVTLARRLHAEGYPVYCFIEEGHEINIRVLKELGFTEVPSYRVTWFKFNDL
ncbi:glycine N-acyltransferase-like [Echeneis naucrates]|uniref:glycine N-acyltransferase-like n=1 Tax=Echeneis naucrates TaxID=173247 RepID=UPI001113A465|nr:glycine N-acyltransferase-like [Echeneis naucrates]